MTHLNDVFSSYNDIYTQSFIVRPDEIDGELCVTLTEGDKKAKLKTLKIRNVPKKTILLPLYQYSKLNVDKDLRTIFNNELGVFKCCDYVLITINNDKLYYIFIEMKSSKPCNYDVKKQFKGATSFIGYSNAIIEQFCNITSFESISLNMRYHAVHQGTYNKRATQWDRYKCPSSPDNFYPHWVEKDKEVSAQFGSFLK
jgi:hypothetical protein